MEFWASIYGCIRVFYLVLTKTYSTQLNLLLIERRNLDEYPEIGPGR